MSLPAPLPVMVGFVAVISVLIWRRSVVLATLAGSGAHGLALAIGAVT